MHKNRKRKMNQSLGAKLQVGRFCSMWFPHIQCLTQALSCILKAFRGTREKKKFIILSGSFVLTFLKIMFVKGQIQLVPIKQG